MPCAPDVALPENGVCGQYAGRDGGIGDGDATGQDLAGTIEKSNKVIEQETETDEQISADRWS